MSSTGNTAECQDSGTPESAGSAAVVDVPLPRLPSSSSTQLEPLSCTACRARKLRCDRVKPVCTRCAKAPTECVYPGRRRKPVFKRRNVKELEARLAQVEGLLQGAGNNVAVRTAAAEELDDDFMYGDVYMDDEDALPTYAEFTPSTGPGPSPDAGAGPFGMPLGRGPASKDSPGPGALLGLGISESLPPPGMIEELHDDFFQKHHSYVPIIHPSRYLRAFYSSPHMKPPMSLQYIIWATAACGHDKYDSYHDIFYRRARMYVEVDEMKGVGEHFITVRHAQALILLATYQARVALFTRSSMDAARAIRLACMMGLHRIDGGMGPMKPTLAPATSWLELEERRRTFWGVYYIDSHSSIATGWPSVVDRSEIFTRLPCSEEAFTFATSDSPAYVDEETAPTIQEALDGAPYGPFAGTVIICHVYTKLLKHIHRPTADEGWADVENGAFWKRHRDLDDLLTTVFMYLPDRFCIDHVRDASSVHTNMNLHAAVICLHHAAVARIGQYKLSETLRMTSRNRIKAAADEIVNMIRLTSHVNRLDASKSPFVSLSLYICATAYISLVLDNRGVGLSEPDRANLIMVIKAMDAIAKAHYVTKAYLQQLRHDIEGHGLMQILDIPNFTKMTTSESLARCHVPLIAQSRVTSQPKQATFMQAHLGLAAAKDGPYPPTQTHRSSQVGNEGMNLAITGDPSRGYRETKPRENLTTNKRKRMCPPPSANESSFPLWQTLGVPRMRAADALHTGIDFFLPDRTSTPPSTAQIIFPETTAAAVAAASILVTGGESFSHDGGSSGVASNLPPGIGWRGEPFGGQMDSVDTSTHSPSSATNTFSSGAGGAGITPDMAPDVRGRPGSAISLMRAMESNMASSSAGDQQETPKDMIVGEGVPATGHVFSAMMDACDIQEIMQDNVSWDWAGGGMAWNDGQAGNDGRGK